MYDHSPMSVDLFTALLKTIIINSPSFHLPLFPSSLKPKIEDRYGKPIVYLKV